MIALLEEIEGSIASIVGVPFTWKRMPMVRNQRYSVIIKASRSILLFLFWPQQLSKIRLRSFPMILALRGSTLVERS